MTDWFDKIVDACWSGAFTRQDKKDAESFSKCCVSEFITQRHPNIPGKYRKLGERFYVAVIEDNTKLAFDVWFELSWMRCKTLALRFSKQ